MSVEICFSLSAKTFKLIPLKPIPNIFLNNNKVIDYLENNPWIKFKPNSLIASPFYRGNNFIYSWKTDKYGYKNNYNFDKNDNVYAIAIGDSYTEGMGVETKDTWPAILSKKIGKKIYNAGVQGYAPLQFKGTLDFLKDKINFEAVIIGHLVGISDRNKNFIKKKISKGTGGIEWIRANKGSVMVSQITKIIIYKIRQIFKKDEKIKDIKKYQTILVDEKLKYKYISEINFNNKKDFDLKTNDNFKTTIDTYLEIANWCEKNKKKLYIIFMTNRTEVYFSGMDESYYDLEKNLISLSFSNFDYTLISTKEALIEYTKKNLDKLPYLLEDGHLSSYGNKIVAEKVSEFIK